MFVGLEVVVGRSLKSKGEAGAWRRYWGDLVLEGFRWKLPEGDGSYAAAEAEEKKQTLTRNSNGWTQRKLSLTSEIRLSGSNCRD